MPLRGRGRTFREVDGKKEFSFNGEVNPAFPKEELLIES